MSKYHSRKVTTAEGTFDSVKECNRWSELKLLERIGKITGLRRQVKFELIPKQRAPGRTEYPVNYIADFVYLQDGAVVVEDVKGYKTREYKIKRKLMLQKYGVAIKEI